MSTAIVTSPSVQQLTAFYEGKTKAILQRYGPGPRVHYHIGFMADPPSVGASTSDLRSALVASQERMLGEASAAWQIRSIPFRDVLDVGCGLGGGAIFWAQEFSANVTALTIAPSHVDIVAAFAQQAGVQSRIRPLLGNALEVPGENCYDVAVAIDSTSSFARQPWFQRLHYLIRPGGHVFIFDCFLECPEYAEPFNRHWCAQIGTVDEYLAGALRAGFRQEMIEDVSLQALHFWDATIALMLAEARENLLSLDGRINLQKSLYVHSLVREGVSHGGLRHMLMSFVRR